MRTFIPALALAAAVAAAIADPASTADLLLAAVPVGAFAVWAVAPRVPLWALSVAVIVPVAAAQHSGGLEPLLFEVSLLGFVIGRWATPLVYSVALAVLALTAPVAASVIQNPSELAVGNWLLGIALPWVLGLFAARQSRLVTELDATRQELARQAVLAERREIARDVHDLVGHGLTAVLLQVTSARHVLLRDPASAEEALREAEATGRRSMGELRRTLTLLRSDGGAEVAPPVPTAAEIPALVERAQAGGLAVDVRMRGDLSAIPQSVGAALYRIAEEALANAARHAPDARTVVELELANERVSLVAKTSGPLAAVDARERPRYGLIGMRERATAVGGTFAAGPTAGGWRVTCELPVGESDEMESQDSRGS